MSGGDVRFDVVVIGAGAAGMMCAATAGLRRRRVLLIEHYSVLGEKIRISGGGRCNFTNLGAGPGNFLSRNPEFCKSALARYTPRDFIALVERYRIGYHEKKLGQLFCDDTARDLIAMLKAECDRGHVAWRMPCPVDGIVFEGGAWRIATPIGAVSSASLVIATGGLTVPKIGATPFGYRVAEQFGLRVVAPSPALVPLALPPEALMHWGELSGVALDAEVTCGPGRFRENLLFTHRGLSGPVILQISSYWNGKLPLLIDVLPEIDATEWLLGERGSPARLDSILARRLPQRFAQRWCEVHDVMKPIRQVPEKRLREVAALLHRWSLLPSGTLGYNKAEVTLGGVDTRELSSQSMMAKNVPGLFFIGEVVDVTGWLGGYNFQWAWSSGHAAGTYV